MKKLIWLFFVISLIFFVIDYCSHERIEVHQIAKMEPAVQGYSAIMLDGEKILITGGDHNRVTLKKARIFNTKTNKFKNLPDMNIARAAHTSTLLKDGRVLITGGYRSIRMKHPEHENVTSIPRLHYDSKTAEIYDPVKNKFIKIGDMLKHRESHKAVLLNDGRVLIIGGDNRKENLYNIVTEIYDPDKNKFEKTGSLNKVRGGFQATLLDDGGVLITGGAWKSRSKAFEVYNPETGMFSLFDEMLEYRTHHKAFRLKNGNVLIAGNRDVNCIDYRMYEIYDYRSNRFIKANQMINNRETARFILLKDNKLLVLGGNRDSVDGEIFDPNTMKSKLVKFKFFGHNSESHKDFIKSHRPLLLRNGNVILIGIGSTDSIKIISLNKLRRNGNNAN